MKWCPGDKIKCGVCYEDFFSLSKYLHHGCGGQKFICQKCWLRIPWRDFYSHSCSVKYFECPGCGWCSSNKKSLEIHMMYNGCTMNANTYPEKYVPEIMEINKNNEGVCMQNIFNWYREWKAGKEEEKDFYEFWDKSVRGFDGMGTRDYHRSMAFEVYKAQCQIEELKKELAELKKAAPKEKKA